VAAGAAPIVTKLWRQNFKASPPGVFPCDKLARAPFLPEFFGILGFYGVGFWAVFLERKRYGQDDVSELRQGIYALAEEEVLFGEVSQDG
jgi:hypothetical protein